jgi:hypothetical protein
MVAENFEKSSLSNCMVTPSENNARASGVGSHRALNIAFSLAQSRGFAATAPDAAKIEQQTKAKAGDARKKMAAIIPGRQKRQR